MKSRKGYRLSPNEEGSVLKKKLEEKRRTRLIQVREQERGLAHKMCQNVQNKRYTERRLLNDHIQASITKAHQKELEQLEVDYSTRVDQIGQGHRAAQQAMQDEHKLEESRLLLEAKRRWCAETRHQTAMEELILDRKYRKNKEDQFITTRNKALEMERERSRRIAGKPLPAGQPLIVNCAVSKGHRVQFKEADSYACTYYHLPHTVVQKDLLASQTALENAAEQRGVDEELCKKLISSLISIKQLARIIREYLVSTKLKQDEKAQIRHKYALAKVKLAKEKEDVMSQLKVLEREDRTQRQKSLARMPRNLFQPVHQRIEVASEQQKDMQQAFEKLLIRMNRPTDESSESFKHTSTVHTGAAHGAARAGPTDESSELSKHTSTVHTGETHVELSTDESSGSSTLCHSKDGSADLDASSSAGYKENSLYPSQNGLPSLQGFLTGDSSPANSAELIKNADDSPIVSDLIMEDITSSLQSDGDIPRTKPPKPILPPNLSKPMNTKDPLPLKSRYTIPPPQKACLTSKLTQTKQTPVYLPYSLIDQPGRPDLSFPDVTSSSICTKIGGQLYSMTEEKANDSKPRRLPKGKVPNEAMQMLVSMVREQHEAWRERKAAARPAQNSPPHSAQDEKNDQFAEQYFTPDGTQEISVHALSTRPGDGVTLQCGIKSQEEGSFPGVSTQYQTTSEVFSLTPETAQGLQDGSMQVHAPSHSSRCSAMLSPAPLSISPYNTTVEVSSLHELSGSPDFYETRYTGTDSFSLHSPKLSISPYNTTLEGSFLDSPYPSCSKIVTRAPYQQYQAVASSNIDVEGRPQSEQPGASNRHEHYQAVASSNIDVEGRPQSEQPGPSNRHEHYQAVASSNIDVEGRSQSEQPGASNKYRHYQAVASSNINVEGQSQSEQPGASNRHEHYQAVASSNINAEGRPQSEQPGASSRHEHYQAVASSNINAEGRPQGQPGASNRHEHYQAVASSNINAEDRPQGQPGASNTDQQASGMDYSALDAHRDMSISTVTATELYAPCLHTDHHSPLVPEHSIHADSHNEPKNGDIDPSDNPFSSLACPPFVNMHPLLAPSLDVTLSSLAEQEMTEIGSKDRVNCKASLWPVVLPQPLQSSNLACKYPVTSTTAEMKRQAITFQKLFFPAHAGASSTELVPQVANTPDDNIPPQEGGPSMTKYEEDVPLNSYYSISRSDPTAPEFNLVEKHSLRSPPNGGLQLDEEHLLLRASDRDNAQPLTGFLPSMISPEEQSSSRSSPADFQTAGRGAEEASEPSECSQDQHTVSRPPLELQQEYGQASELLAQSTAAGTESQLEQFQLGCLSPKLHYQALSSSRPLTRDPPFQFSSNIGENTSPHWMTEAQPLPLPTLDQYSMHQFYSINPAHASPFLLTAGTPATTQENINGNLSQSPALSTSSRQGEDNSGENENKTEAGFPAVDTFGTYSSPRISLTQASYSGESLAKQQNKKLDVFSVNNSSSQSLQDVFLLKKPTLVSNSQNRMKNLKSCALQRQRTLHSGSERVGSATASTGRGKEAKSEVGKSKKKTVSFCSPKHLASAIGPTSLPIGTTAHHVGSDTVASRQRQVPKKREMKERTLKLYKCLAEVKLKREKDERTKAYAENRRKAKAYQEKFQARSKVIQSEEHKPADSSNKGRVPVKRPFK